jgi:hypothetical protein
MKRPAQFVLILAFSYFASCKKSTPDLSIADPVKKSYAADSLALSKADYRDRVLGALVGSAIGDAMGASTEMWYRGDIQLKYGYITGLTPAVREQSPEGTWEHNLGPGATTDDTRWKYLMVAYFNKYGPGISPEKFAAFITDYYQSVAGQLKEKEILNNPDLLDKTIKKVDWIKEWARVTLSYQNGPAEYTRAMNRFYGGEMSCAGMLYSPMFGLVASGSEAAYEQAYEHGIFDLGYARDISSLLAAMTRMALQTSSMDSILDTAVFVDPYRYQDSRLVGRISLAIANDSRRTVRLSGELPVADTLAPAAKPPRGFPGTRTDWMRQDYVYSKLEKDQKAIPFHAGEIWEIVITALEFGQGNFEKTMQFIVNYGRDNDTAGAVAGMILGARLGFNRLPEDLRTQVLNINKEQMGIDLEALASEMTGISGKATQ